MTHWLVVPDDEISRRSGCKEGRGKGGRSRSIGRGSKAGYFSNVKIEPIFTEMVDFDTFAKSDFRAVKILACEAVKKSKKLLRFTLDDGERKDRVILSGIHEYYEPEELVDEHQERGYEFP